MTWCREEDGRVVQAKQPSWDLISEPSSPQRDLLLFELMLLGCASHRFFLGLAATVLGYILHLANIL